MEQNNIDASIQTFYGEVFDENARLTTRSTQGRLEFERTQEILRQSTPAPARVLDVGGATGVHAAALSGAGYEVVLIDPVPAQVSVAATHRAFRAQVGDARNLEFADNSFDAVLMAGPLYHLAHRDDRLQALREARRVCRPGGFVHAAAIPRLSAVAIATLNWELLGATDHAVLKLIRSGEPAVGRFPAGHFHTPEELQDELIEAGLSDVLVAGLEGPAGIALETITELPEADYLAAKRLAVLFQHTPQIRDFSCHILGTGRVFDETRTSSSFATPPVIGMIGQ